MRSTYTWQLPDAAKITGTVATPLSAAFRPSPPRGMIRSTDTGLGRKLGRAPRVRRRRPATARPPAGRRSTAASAAISASTAFECAAELEPRSTIALPDFRHSAAASIVTFGPGLVDDRDDAERHAHLADVEPVRKPEAVDHLADGVRERGDLAGALRDRSDPLRVQRQAVEQGGTQARRTSRLRGRERWPRGSPACARSARQRSPRAPRS